VSEFSRLPQALRRSSLERLAFVSEMTMGALVLSELVHWAQVLINRDAPLFANTLARLLMVWQCWKIRAKLRQEEIPPAVRLLRARLWIWLTCLGVVYMEFRSLPPGAPLAAAGVSRGCLPLILAPVLIPDSLQRSLKYGGLLLLTFPAGYLLSRITGGAAQSSTEIWVRICNDLIMLGAAWTTAATVNQLREAVVEQFGSYRKVRLLGKGGFGEVWEARHRLMQRPAALKLLAPDCLDKISTRRFLREAESLSMLQCPHTVRLYDYGQNEEGQLFLAMELLQGLNLEELVQLDGPQPPERVAHLLSQACLSLQEAHEQGLIHRDIKPANLFLCNFGMQPDFLKVLDFGLVKPPEPGGLTQTDQVLGTPDYIAPETVMGQTPDGRTDLYSLGCVGYFLLTGRPVFEREQPMQVILDHLQTQPGRLQPTPLGEAIMKCLAKSPHERPSSAAELYQVLQGCPMWESHQAARWWDKWEKSRRFRSRQHNDPR